MIDICQDVSSSLHVEVTCKSLKNTDAWDLPPEILNEIRFVCLHKLPG
jgi:hypothetical protein